MIERIRTGVLAVATIAISAACARGGGKPVEPETPAPVDIAVRLTKPDRDVALALAPRPGAWAPDDGWLASTGWRATGSDRFDRFVARLPLRADGPLEVGQGRFERFRLSVRAEGASPAEVRLHEGRAYYEDVFPATDVVVGATDDALEELLVLRDPSAPAEFAWTIDQPRGLPNVRVEESGAIVFADVKDEGVLRIPPAYAFDANGQKRQATMTYGDHRLTVKLDTRGLAYPIALDPVLEAFLWEDRGAAAVTARCGHALTFDSARNVTVLFGGNDCSTSVGFVDVWEWNGSVWTPRCGAGATAACGVAAGAVYPAGAFHPGRAKSLFIGMTAAVGSMIAEWDGTTLAPLPSTPADNTSYPLPRGSASMAFDSARNELVLHAGASFGGMNDTWTFSAGAAWTRKGQVNCGVGAPCRSAGAMAFHPDRGKAIAFGGSTGGSGGAEPGHFSWEWDGAAWSYWPTTIQPGARNGPGMAYDSRRRLVIMFGGNVGPPPNLSDTWEWGASGVWQPRFPVTHPPGSSGVSLAFDSARGRIVMLDGAARRTWEYRTHGGACTTGSQCDTGNCVDGVCCESSACGSCQACNGSNPGVCTAVTNGNDDTCLAPTRSCDGSGVCRAVQGQSCTVGANCLSGHCVDDVCCDTACGGTCQACSAATKQSGADDGVCGPAANGQNPHGDCLVTPAANCDTDGFCNGTGQCRKYAAGTACGAGVVCDPITNSAKGQLCNGAGSCLPATDEGTSCGQFDCVAGSGCGSTCATDSDCIPTAYCDANVCKAKTPDGTACTTGDSCETGVCVDGVCCNRPCDGQCEACDVNGAEGKCVPVVGAPHGARAACAGATDDNVCSAQSCNGDDATSCKGFVSSSTECRQPSCENGVQTLLASCDGKGECPAAVTKRCEPFLCDSETKACKVECASDADCVSGNKCDAASKKCVSGATCNGSVVTDALGKTTECAPYNCEGNGTCKTTCASVNDCAGAFVCDSANRCVPPSSSSGESGCAVSARPSDPSHLALLALGGVLALARRRQRRGADRKSYPPAGADRKSYPRAAADQKS